MKKIFIVLNIMIMCLCLSSCKEEEIKYKDEIIDLIYDKNFERLGYFYYDGPNQISRRSTANIFDIFVMNLEKNKFYEATIIEKKVIAGFYADEVVEEINKLNIKHHSRPENYEFEYKMTWDGFSSIYNSLLDLNKMELPDFNCNDFDVDLCFFEDGIPLNYNDKKLGFVLRYYGIKLNNGRKIVSVEYCTGDIINNYFYPHVRNHDKCEPLNYGKFIYIEHQFANVVEYSDFSFYIIPEDSELKYTMSIFCNTYKDETLALFNHLKGALKDESPNKEFNCSGVYHFDYNKLKDILVK